MRRRQQVEAELGFHVEMRVRELMARGMSPDDARREAVGRLGDPAQLTAQLTAIGEARDRQVRRTEYLSDLVSDLRFAIRQMIAAPAFAAIAIGTLATGIGGTTAIFSAVRAVLLRPFPWAHPARTMYIPERWHDQDGNTSVGNYVDWVGLTSTFAALGAERFASFTLGGAGSPERARGGRVTASFFTVFGQRPLLGRTFRPDEDAPGSDRVVMLSERLWREQFGADSAILNHSVSIDMTPYTVVGIMPLGFDPTLSGEQLWVPIAFTPAQRAEHDEHNLLVVGLLEPSASLAAAQRDVRHAAAELAQRYPKEDGERTAAVYPLGPYLIGNARDQLLFVLGAVTFVFLIACVNVANLLMARASVRAKELAIRAAIGAGRRRLIRQLLTETALLSLVASALGVALAAILIRVLVAAAPVGVIPRLDETRIDLVVLGFALAVAGVATFASGLLPAVKLARQDPHETLRGEGRGIGGSRSRERIRGALVTAEVTLALMLLVGSGLLVKSALVLERMPLGFDTSSIASAGVLLPIETYTDPARVRHTFEGIAQELVGSAGVEHAALVSVRPLGGPGSDNGVIPEGRPLVPANAIDANLRIITPDYFTTMRIPLVRGRAFTAADVRGTNRVMIVSERFAHIAWPGIDPIGRRVVCCEGSQSDPMWKTIVGVAGDVRSRGPTGAIDPEFYLPVDQAPDDAWRWIGQSMTMVIRARSTTDAVDAMRAAVRATDPGLPIFNIESGNDAFRAVLAPARFNALLLGALAAIGLALSAAGIFGVIAYFVALRTHEIGVRRALGATPSDVLWLMLRQGVQPVVLGLALGTVASLFGAQLLRSALYGVRPADLMTFAVVAVVLSIVALLAILIPARRALRIEPTRALQLG
jgi:putative ABC transport system permease protein